MSIVVIVVVVVVVFNFFLILLVIMAERLQEHSVAFHAHTDFCFLLNVHLLNGL